MSTTTTTVTLPCPECGEDISRQACIGHDRTNGAAYWKAERDDLAARIAIVEALHTPVKVWQYDGTEGVFVFDQDDELVLLTTLCSECTDPDVLDQVEDCEYREGTGHEVEHPCSTIKALRGEEA